MARATIFIITVLAARSFAAGPVESAVAAANIRRNDTLETKIDKVLKLLNEERYFFPKHGEMKLRPPFDNPYHLDSLRTADQILSQKVGGSCGSSALAFAAMLVQTGYPAEKIQIVGAISNWALRAICPTSGQLRKDKPEFSSTGHTFVALQFPDGSWKIINPIDGSVTYGKADWHEPKTLQQKMQNQAVAIPSKVFERLPKDIYRDGLTVFQSWSLKDYPLHTYEQRYDLVASGTFSGAGERNSRRCRFTAPKIGGGLPPETYRPTAP